VSFEQIETIAKNTEKEYLKDVSLFDVFTGENLPDGKKSYGVNFILQDNQATLQEKQIDKIMSKLQKAFENEINAILR
jgi:phenylalanyl-tRNA synthetase beta chain